MLSELGEPGKGLWKSSHQYKSQVRLESLKGAYANPATMWKHNALKIEDHKLYILWV